MKQLFHNEDCTEFFWKREIPEGKAGEIIDQYIDVMADAGVTVFLLNTNSRRTNYRSQAWETFWDGYDPTGPDDQPFLAPIPRDGVASFRKGIGNMLAVHQQKIDYPARVIKRCRSRDVSPWITLRMNDCHENDNMDHPFHGSFWKKNPQFYRKNSPGYFACCLDYAHQEVRDYFMALIVETLDRYDIDGLELDFMREPYLFSAGKEAEGAVILNEWLRDIRRRVIAAGKKRGHPIRLGVRVPSKPEVATGWGLDFQTWVNEGVIDLLVVTPRWTTLEFDMPIRQWRDMLGKSKVTLAGGLEVSYRPYWDPDTWHTPTVSPELAVGAALMVLSQGADAVYLFNYFQPLWGLPVYQKTLKAMASLDLLQKLPRSFGVTFRDILAPGENYHMPLPATGREIMFQMNLGPIPDKAWNCELLIGLAPSQDNSMPVPMASINGKPCEALSDTKTKEGPGCMRLVTFQVPMSALTKTGAQEIRIIAKEPDDITIKQVQISLRPKH